MAPEDGDDTHLVEEDGYDVLLDLLPAIRVRIHVSVFVTSQEK